MDKNHLRPRSIGALAALGPVLVLAVSAGCSSSSTNNGPDGGTVMTPDAGDDGTDAGTRAPDASSPDATSSGDAGTGVLGFTPSNGIAAALAGVDLTMLPDIDVSNADEQLGVDCNSNSGCVAKTVVQSDGSSIQVYFAKSWKIEPAGALNVVDKVPVVIVALGAIDILGRLSLHASADQTVAGGFTGTVDGTAGGPGEGGLGVERVESVDTGIAGGGAGFCGAGGPSGKATATNGAAGKTYGTPTLVPLVGGSAGGRGSLSAGGGGGAVELVAGTSITIASGGVVSAGGGAGYDGTDDGLYVASGGGSGGAVLIEAPLVTVAGTIAANGGAGGGGASGTLSAHDAAESATAAVGGQVGTTGAGGNGSAAATIAGAAGGAGDALGGNFSPGGGGGGAGYIRINTTAGSATVSGTLSPAAGSTCVSQGALAK
jgi:hypothetical protein